MIYNWQQKDWPHFRYDESRFEEKLYAYTEQQGFLVGMINTLPEGIGQEAVIDIMVAEAVKSSEIEGEYISREDVLSSIRNNLGLNKIPERIRDKRAAGIARMTVHIRETFKEPLSEASLFLWHEMVMESYRNINIGKWRTSKEPMQVISGSIGKEIVHFEAPPAHIVPKEMQRFIKWYNGFDWRDPKNKIQAIIQSAVAHLYFESIHPFEDGNGRIGRALSEKILSQALGQPILFSLSKSIEKNKLKYYAALKQGQSTNDIHSWILYFVDIILEAQREAINQIQFTIYKTQFFDRVATLINQRQEKVLQKMLSSPIPFEGGMNVKKYVSITKTSRATATRDLQALVQLKILVALGGGRSTRYELLRS